MNMSPNAESGLSAKSALCLAAITMVGIDGEFKEEELERLRQLIHTDEDAFIKAISYYTDQPLDVCLKVISKRLNPEQKQITYRVLYDLAQVDKDFAVSEQDLLNQYAAMFGLSKNFVASISGPATFKYDLSAFE
jgi:uncharacterized tellurite resistance protein B-like protein